MIKVSDSAMAKNDGCSYQVLLEAESLSPSLLEDRALELLEVANTVLSRSDSSHEMKLDCLRWIGDKLVSHVLMGEMEDYILKPFLPSALDFIEEIISVTVDTSHGNTLELSAIMVSLLQQSNKVRFVFIIIGIALVIYLVISRLSDTVTSHSQSSARCPVCLKLCQKS